jgi:UDP-N-acetylglucosamine 2-epimerase (non-hydrolysing)
MKKVSIIIGTRPEAIKMAPVYITLKKHLGDSVQLISTGQHKELLWPGAEVL